MSKPYDAVAKELLVLDPPAWAAFLGVRSAPGAVSVIDSDLATVTTAADKVLWIADDPPWVLDVEFQSTREPSVPRQLLKYNGVLQERHKCAAASVLVVLREAGDSPAYSGTWPVAPPFGPAWEFRYTVVKLWEASAERLLSGPLALTPLAPVADLGPLDLTDVLRRTLDRETREAPPEVADRMFAAIGILLTMRYGEMTTKELLSRFPELRDMAPFKMYLDDGRAEGRATEARAVLARLGRKKFGPPGPGHEAALAAVTDLAHLEELTERLLDVSTWDELFAKT